MPGFDLGPKKMLTLHAKRANTLLATLMLVLVALLIALAGAAGLATHYGLANRYYDSAQADLWARAGVQEFLLRSSQLQEESALVTSLPSPLLDKFRGHEQLLEPSERMPARVRLQLERCRDNSLSAVAAPGYYDRGGATSIPPYSFGLALEVSVGSRKLNYEACVQQRWPYAIAGAGPICLVGNQKQGGMTSGAQTFVQGPVLALQSEILDPGSERVVDNPTTAGLAESLAPFCTGQKSTAVPEAYSVPGPWTLFRLQIGGSFRSWAVQSDYDQTLAPPRMVRTLVPAVYQSCGAVLDGPAYFMENLPDLREAWACEPVLNPVTPESRFRGPLRKSFRLWDLPPQQTTSRRRLQRLVSPPDTSAWPVLSNPSEARRLVLTGNPAGSAGDGLRIPGGKARVVGDLNLENLTLQECSLAVWGDCRILGSPERSGPALRGDRASLVVHGTLMLDEAVMDAGGLGMVIYCDSFFIRAKGEYRGLIVSREGGCFFGAGASSSPELRIRGGLVCGGNRASIVSEDFGKLSLRALTLVSTDLRYAPEYVPTLNQFAVMTLLSVRRRP